jgi:hypothetical protein
MRLLLLLASIGCVESALSQITDHGAHDLDCPRAEVTLSELGGQKFEVVGCGSLVRYVCTQHEDGLHCPKEGPVRPDGSVAVEVVKGSNPPGCREIGPVQVESFTGKYEELYRRFRAEVHRRGGNLGRLDVAGDFKLAGVALICPRAGAPTDPGTRASL